MYKALDTCGGTFSEFPIFEQGNKFLFNNK